MIYVINISADVQYTITGKETDLITKLEEVVDHNNYISLKIIVITHTECVNVTTYSFNKDCDKLIHWANDQFAPIETPTIKNKLLPKQQQQQELTNNSNIDYKTEYIIFNDKNITGNNIENVSMLKCNETTLQETINKLITIEHYKIMDITNTKLYMLNNDRTKFITNGNSELALNLDKFLDVYCLHIFSTDSMNNPNPILSEHKIERKQLTILGEFTEMNNFCKHIRDQVTFIATVVKYAAKIHITRNGQIIGKFISTGLYYYTSVRDVFSCIGERVHLIAEYESLCKKLDAFYLNY